jgi:hypothetical protein
MANGLNQAGSYYFRYCPKCLVHNYFRPNPEKKGIICEDCGYEISLNDYSFFGLKPNKPEKQSIQSLPVPS